MAAEVHALPGVFRADLEQSTAPADSLRAALDAGLRDVAVVGRTLSGEVVVFGSAAEIDATIGLLTRGIAWLAACEQVAAPADEGEPS